MNRRRKKCRSKLFVKKRTPISESQSKKSIVCNTHVLVLVSALFNSDIVMLVVGSSFRIQLREILSVHITIEGPSQLILLEFDIKFKFQRFQTERLQKLPFM